MSELTKWMTRNNVKQPQIAEWLGKSQPAVSNIVNGNTTLHPNDAKVLIAKSKGELNWEKLYGKVTQ